MSFSNWTKSKGETHQTPAAESSPRQRPVISILKNCRCETLSEINPNELKTNKRALNITNVNQRPNMMFPFFLGKTSKLGPTSKHLNKHWDHGMIEGKRMWLLIVWDQRHRIVCDLPMPHNVRHESLQQLPTHRSSYLHLSWYLLWISQKSSPPRVSQFHISPRHIRCHLRGSPSRSKVALELQPVGRLAHSRLVDTWHTQRYKEAYSYHIFITKIEGFCKHLHPNQD